MNDRDLQRLEDFWAFHRKNPQVYEALVRLAREWKQKGADRCGIKMLFEVLRWENGLKTTGDQYKLCNNHHSYYARLIMMQEKDLEGLFEIREW